jgi:hypothetical protein
MSACASEEVDPDLLPGSRACESGACPDQGAFRDSPIEEIDSVAAETAEETGIPVAFPDALPAIGEPSPLYATVLSTGDGMYEINLGYVPECTGGNACSWGNLAGKRDDGKLTGTPNFPYDLKEAKPIPLAGGVQGYFIESRCGANCDDAKVFWIQNGVQYMVGIKAGSEPAAVEMANSAIGHLTATNRR